MSLLTVFIAIVVFGILLWLVNSISIIDHKAKTLLNGLLMILLVIYLLKVFGIWSYMAHFPV